MKDIISALVLPFNISIPTSIYQNIPCYQRFQWLNSEKVVEILSCFLKPNKRGRKGYDKVIMFRWLLWKHLAPCTYRDLEGMSGIDYTTFIKFRKRLIKTLWFSIIFKKLVNWIISQTNNSLCCLLDSSFVETYSKKQEKGSEYSGFKKKTGFKLHSAIDFNTRLPLKQLATGGARSDITIGKQLIRGSPKYWKVKELSADKGYDGAYFVSEIYHKWKGIEICIPLRKTNQEKAAGKQESTLNRQLKLAERTITQDLLNKRTEIERYFSRKKRIFNLGEEKTRGLTNFRANCYLTSICEILEFIANNPSFQPLLRLLFTKLIIQHLKIISIFYILHK